MNIEFMIEKLRSCKSFLSLEVSPSVSAQLDKQLVEQLQDIQKVDAFVCTDSPLARFKPSSILNSIKLHSKSL